MSRVISRHGKSGLVAATALLCAIPVGGVSALDMSPGQAGWSGEAQTAPLVSSPTFDDADGVGPERCQKAAAAHASGSMPLAVRAQQGKGAAILGGMSALELMRSEQVSFAQPAAGELQTTAEIMNIAMTLKPAIGGYVTKQKGCDTAAQPALMNRPGMNSLPSSVAPRPSDFLQSRRVAIGSTRFDAQWRRVSRGSLSSQQLSRIVGKRPQKGAALLGRINAWVNNNINYVEDSRLWGSADYWATASETLARARGDCEDLAIVKMKLLERAGIRPEDMYLTVARDLYRNADHAFLVVKLDGRYFVLDNAVDRILPADQDLGYRPILSFSAYRSWLHGY